MRALLFAILLTGCVPGSFERLPRQDEAERIVWRDLYGMIGDDAPPVEWFVDEDSTVGGCALPGWKVRVMREDSSSSENGGPMVTRRFSETAYAHELMHYATYLRTGDIDAAHWRGDWELADETAKLALWKSDL